MRANRGAAGEGKIGCILWTALVVVGGLIAWKAIPVKIAAAELQDFMVEQAKFAASSPAETILARIVNKAAEHELDVAIRYEARERAFRCHGQVPDLVLAHELDRLLDGRLGFHGVGERCHQVAELWCIFHEGCSRQLAKLCAAETAACHTGFPQRMGAPLSPSTSCSSARRGAP